MAAARSLYSQRDSDQNALRFSCFSFLEKTGLGLFLDYFKKPQFCRYFGFQNFTSF
jgi:hypothetical protein